MPLPPEKILLSSSANPPVAEPVFPFKISHPEPCFTGSLERMRGGVREEALTTSKRRKYTGPVALIFSLKKHCEPVTREAVIRNFFIWLFTPLARLLSGWNPDIFTWVSLIAGCAAGLAYHSAGRGSVFYLFGGLLVAISGACDSLDGIVARLGSRTSRGGDFLDHFFDRIVDAAILYGLAYSPDASTALGVFCLVFALLNAYLATQIEASFGHRYYGGIGKAEMFVGIIALSIFSWLFPGPFLQPAGFNLTLVNLFFIVLASMTLLSFTTRILHLRTLLKS